MFSPVMGTAFSLTPHPSTSAAQCKVSGSTLSSTEQQNKTKSCQISGSHLQSQYSGSWGRMSWRASLRYTEVLPRPSVNLAQRNAQNIASLWWQHMRIIAFAFLPVQGLYLRVSEHTRCIPGTQGDQTRPSDHPWLELQTVVLSCVTLQLPCGFWDYRHAPPHLPSLFS